MRIGITTNSIGSTTFVEEAQSNDKKHDMVHQDMNEDWFSVRTLGLKQS